MTDRWKAAIASVAELLRECSAGMERGELPPVRAPIMLLNVARVIEEVPAPPLGADKRAELKARIMKAIGVAVDLHDIDDHALYLMRDVGVGGGNSDGEEAAGLIAEAVLTEIGFPRPSPPLTDERVQSPPSEANSHG